MMRWLDSKILMMSPTCPAASASGLMMVSVRSNARLLLVRLFLGADFALKGSRHGFADQRGTFRHANACGFKSRNFISGRTLAAGDDGAGMAHAASWRRGATGNKTDNRFGDLLLNELCCQFLSGAADFSNDDDPARFLIFIHQPESIDEGGSDDGVTSNPNAGGLSDAERGELPDRFVGQSSTA